MNYAALLKKGYFYMVLLSYVLYFVAMFGIYNYNPAYLKDLSEFLKYYICFILIYQFHPFRVSTFDRDDQMIVFSSALFLLSTTGINEILRTYVNRAKENVVTKENHLEVA